MGWCGVGWCKKYMNKYREREVDSCGTRGQETLKNEEEKKTCPDFWMNYKCEIIFEKLCTVEKKSV